MMGEIIFMKHYHLFLFCAIVSKDTLCVYGFYKVGDAPFPNIFPRLQAHFVEYQYKASFEFLLIMSIISAQLLWHACRAVSVVDFVAGLFVMRAPGVAFVFIPTHLQKWYSQ